MTHVVMIIGQWEDESQRPKQPSYLVRPGNATEPGGAEGEGRKEEPFGEWWTTWWEALS